MTTRGGRPTQRHVQSLGRLVWPLYVFFLTWLVLPFYANTAARMLPLSDSDVDLTLALVVVAAGPLAAWSGLRGGPLLMSEAQVLRGLATGRSRPTRIAVVRQAMFTGGFLGLAAAWLTAMASAGSTDVAHSAQRTLLGLEAGVLIISLAVLWNAEGRRLIDRPVAVLITIGMSLAVWLGETPESWLGRLGLITLVALGLAVNRAADIRLDHLWTRSTVLAELQYGAALLDFRSALASLRSTRDGQRSLRGGFGSTWAPPWLWRPYRSFSSAPALVPIRLGLLVLALAVSTVTLEETRSRLAVAAAILAIAAVDLTTPLASVTGKPLLHRGSRIPERLTLTVEATIGIAATGLIGLMAYGIASATRPSLALAPFEAVALAAGAASALQARLGSPDLPSMIDRYGPDQVRSALVARSAVPVLLLFLTVSGVAELTERPRPLILDLLVAAWIGAFLFTTTSRADPETAAEVASRKAKAPA